MGWRNLAAVSFCFWECITFIYFNLSLCLPMNARKCTKVPRTLGKVWWSHSLKIHYIVLLSLLNTGGHSKWPNTWDNETATCTVPFVTFLSNQTLRDGKKTGWINVNCTTLQRYGPLLHLFVVFEESERQESEARFYPASEIVAAKRSARCPVADHVTRSRPRRHPALLSCARGVSRWAAGFRWPSVL